MNQCSCCIIVVLDCCYGSVNSNVVAGMIVEGCVTLISLSIHFIPSRVMMILD